MAISLTAVVEALVGTKRYAVDLTVDVENNVTHCPCFWCGSFDARRVVIKAHRVWRSENGRIIEPGLVRWMDAVYAAEDRLGHGRPVCVQCWDHVLLPFVRQRALFK